MGVSIELSFTLFGWYASRQAPPALHNGSREKRLQFLRDRDPGALCPLNLFRVNGMPIPVEGPATGFQTLKSLKIVNEPDHLLVVLPRQHARLRA